MQVLITVGEKQRAQKNLYQLKYLKGFVEASLLSQLFICGFGFFVVLFVSFHDYLEFWCQGET